MGGVRHFQVVSQPGARATRAARALQPSVQTPTHSRVRARFFQCRSPTRVVRWGLRTLEEFLLAQPRTRTAPPPATGSHGPPRIKDGSAFHNPTFGMRNYPIHAHQASLSKSPNLCEHWRLHRTRHGSISFYACPHCATSPYRNSLLRTLVQSIDHTQHTRGATRNTYTSALPQTLVRSIHTQTTRRHSQDIGMDLGATTRPTHTPTHSERHSARATARAEFLPWAGIHAI